MPGPRRRFLLICNPLAGRRGRELLRPTLEHLERAGSQITHAPAGSPDATRQAIAEAMALGGCDAVLIAGGDGSFRVAGSAMLDADVPIGLIPLGTGNVLAHELDLPQTPYEIARMLLDGATTTVHSATANGETFFLMAGVGFDGRVIARLDPRIKHRLGKIAYVSPVLQALAEDLPRLVVTIDGAPHAASWAVVSNACRYGGRFILVPHTHAGDHGLHAVVFKSRDRMALTRQLIDLARGTLLQRSDVRMLPCRHVTILATEPTCVQIDGDPSGLTPLDIATSDAVVRVIVPDARSGPA